MRAKKRASATSAPSKGRTKQTSAPTAPKRLTSRVQLSQLQMWVNELAALGFSTRDIARVAYGSQSESGRVSHIANGHHMGDKPQCRPTEDDFSKLRAVYFIAVQLADKLTPLRDAALQFHGDMSKAQASAANMVEVATRLASKVRK